MSRIKLYIKPFQSDGSYADEFIDVTEDANIGSIGSVQESIDQDDYEVGIFKFNQFRITLNNSQGKYSDVGESKTIFSFKRDNSIVKVTWQVQTDITQCGDAICGEAVTNLEKEVFIGLLNDDSLSLNVTDRMISFQVLGIESIFSLLSASFDESTLVFPGVLISTAIYDLLNQSGITQYVTVASENIVPGVDQTIDSDTDLIRKTAKEILDQLLFASNSVLYIKDGVLYVSNREPTAALQKTFYGQASNIGTEDILALNKIKTGINKTFNYWVISDYANLKKDDSSISTNGIQKAEAGTTVFTNSTKIDNVLNNLLAEFKDPKQELEITVPFSYENLDLFILDRIAIDYPTVFVPANDDPSPLYGVAIYGTSLYPIGQWALTISSESNYKILARKVDTKKQIISFKCKKI